MNIPRPILITTLIDIVYIWKKYLKKHYQVSLPNTLHHFSLLLSFLLSPQFIITWGHIFSHVWPPYEWAVSNLDP